MSVLSEDYTASFSRLGATRYRHIVKAQHLKNKSKKLLNLLKKEKIYEVKMVIIDDINKYYEESDKTFLSLIRNNKFEKLLGAMGRFGIFGVKNILLILNQDENASYVNSSRGWNFNGRYVMPTANAIRIVKKESAKEGVDEDEKETSRYVIGLVYDHKWTKKAAYSSRKDDDDFTHVFSAERILKFPKGLVQGISEWAEKNSRAKGTESILVRSDLNTLRNESDIGLPEVKKGIDLASILISMEVCDRTPSLSRYPELRYIVQLAAKYILSERLELERPKINFEHDKYSDFELKEGLLKALYPLRTCTQRVMRQMEVRAYNHEINDHFEKMRRQQIEDNATVSAKNPHRDGGGYL